MSKIGRDSKTLGKYPGVGGNHLVFSILHSKHRVADFCIYCRPWKDTVSF